MRFDILGPLQVLDAGRPLVLGRPKQRAVLAILLLDAGRVVSLDRLVEELWGRQAPPQALSSLQAYVSHLRRLLEPRRAPGAPATVLVNQAPGYRIVVPDADLDAARFQALALRGHDLLLAGDARRAGETLAAALQLWRGPVLADFADASFVQAERARLSDLRLTAAEDRLSAELSLGRHALIAAELEQLTAEHPFRERLLGLRMAALYRSGRQAEALQTYATFRARLRDELGLDPGPALRDLERDILRQAPELEWTPSAGADGGQSGPRMTMTPHGPPAADATGPAAADVLVGREGQLREIERALAEASAGRGRLILVAGEPGIGKTRLAEEAVRRARESGFRVAWGRSDPDAGAPPFWPWSQLLRQLLSDGTVRPPAALLGPYAAELSAILPELTDGDLRAAPVVDPEAFRFRVCQVATTALLQVGTGRRLLLVLDDLQWSDPGSQRLLGHLAATLADAPIVVLVMYRTRDLDDEQSLTEILADLARRPAVARLELTGLGRADVAQLMAAHSGADADDELAGVISDRTGGNPFFVLEVLRLLAASGWPRGTPGHAASLVEEQIPAGVRDVLRRRLSRLPDQTRTVLLVAAVIGHEFALDVVRAVTGLDDDDALNAVELTVSTGLVVEDPARVGRFRFSHALIREAIYGEISRTRQARLHARVGQALLDHRGNGKEHALHVAHHWWLAAPVVGAQRVVPQLIAAADVCLDTLAHEEAERHLRRGLELLATLPPSTDRMASELQVQLRLGALLVGVQLRLGTSLVQPHDSAGEAARASLTRARELADELGDSSAVLAAHRSLYEVALARADHRTAADLAEAMLDLARRSHDPAAVVVGRLALGRTLWAQGRLAAAREHLEQGLRSAGEGDEQRQLLPPRMTLQLQLAAVLDLLGEPAAAAELVTAAVDGCPADRPFARVAALTGAALMAALRRDVPAARRWASGAVDLAAQSTPTARSGYADLVHTWVEALEGDPAAPIPGLRRHLDQIEAGGAQHLVAWGWGLLAEAHLRHGHPAEALRLLDDALARVERTGERLYESELHRLRALSLIASDPPHPEQARRALHRAITVARAQGAALLEQRAIEAGGTVAPADAHLGSDRSPARRPENS